MARGAAQAGRKRAQQDVKPKKAKPAPSWEDQLFFSRLRRHAKVVYVLLAVIFAGGFVFLGVGSGSGGIGDLLQGNFFGNGGSSTSSQISDKQEAIRPKLTQELISAADDCMRVTVQGRGSATSRRRSGSTRGTSTSTSTSPASTRPTTRSRRRWPRCRTRKRSRRGTWTS